MGIPTCSKKSSINHSSTSRSSDRPPESKLRIRQGCSSIVCANTRSPAIRQDFTFALGVIAEMVAQRTAQFPSNSGGSRHRVKPHSHAFGLHVICSGTCAWHVELELTGCLSSPRAYRNTLGHAHLVCQPYFGLARKPHVCWNQSTVSTILHLKKAFAHVEATAADIASVRARRGRVDSSPSLQDPPTLQATMSIPLESVASWNTDSQISCTR